jgi:hypothetical protein
MSLCFNRSAYLKRLGISFGIVCLSTLPAAGWGVFGSVMSPWWAVMKLLNDACHVPLPEGETAALAALLLTATLMVLAVAALHPLSAKAVTLWFAVNALTFWALLATFRLGPAG